MKQHEFSQLEKANQVSEQMQFAVFESHGRAAQFGLYVLAVLMIAGFVWSAFAGSDICAEATGKLEPLERVQRIQPITDGTIAEYKVREGQRVKAGDPLVFLNTVRAEAELTKQKEELSILERQLNDHENSKFALAHIIKDPNSISNEKLAVPESSRIAGQLFAAKKGLDAAAYDISGEGGEYGADISPQMALLRAQRQALNAVKEGRAKSIQHKAVERQAEIKKLEARVSLLDVDVEKARIQLSELEAALSDAKKEMAIYERGRQLGVASEVKFLDVQNYMNQREYSVAQQKLRLSDLEQALKSARVDLDSRGRAYNADRFEMQAGIKSEEARISSVPLSMNEAARALLRKQSEFDVASYHARARYAMELTELRSLERRISACRTAIAVLSLQLAERVLKSPINGTVADLINIQPGQIVLRGQTLMTIVPSDDELVLRAEVSNRDVGFVEVGQDARLRVESFPCEEFGIVHGKVVRVGNYPEQKIEQGKKVSVYRVKIQLDQPFLQVGNNRYQLRPGLEVHADIVLRKRSWLALLFEPLLKINNY